MRAPRPLAPTDLDAVSAIEARVFSDPWSRQAFADLLANCAVHALAADDDAGSLIGYGLCALAADEAEILNLAVAPRARAQGAGRALLESLLEWLRARGARTVFLEVRRSNQTAIALYRRFGFRLLGTRRGYYHAPREDALTMALELPAEGARSVQGKAPK